MSDLLLVYNHLREYYLITGTMIIVWGNGQYLASGNIPDVWRAFQLAQRCNPAMVHSGCYPIININQEVMF
jgi:hypothetical protein